MKTDKKDETIVSEKQNENQMNIELSEEIAEGIYSNLAMIAHSNSEFVIDFIRILPNINKAKVKARLVLTPQHAKRLLSALQENISKYEQNFGIIRESNDHTLNIPMNFSGQIAQA